MLKCLFPIVIPTVGQHSLHKKEAQWVKAKTVLPEIQWHIEVRTKVITCVGLLGVLILSCCPVCLYQLPT